MEVLDAQFEKAKMCARIGDKAGAYAAYNTIAEKAKISTGKKIDAVMAKTRVALFYLETQQVHSRICVCVRARVCSAPMCMAYCSHNGNAKTTHHLVGDVMVVLAVVFPWLAYASLMNNCRRLRTYALCYRYAVLDHYSSRSCRQT